MLLGYSTGAIEGKKYKPKAELLLECGLNAIELSCLKCEELLWLSSELHELKPLLNKFDYVSVHLPTNAKKPSDEDTIIDYIAYFQNHIGKNTNFIIHPDAVFNWDRWGWTAHAPSIVIENMDAKKSFGQTHDSLALLFKMLPQARFCLDTAHCCSSEWCPINYRETQVDLYFKERLAQVHVSAMLNGKHGKLSSKEYKYLNESRTLTILGLAGSDTPLILESPVGSNKNEILEEVEALKHLCGR